MFKIPQPAYASVLFPSFTAFEKAMRIFEADPTIDITILPHAELYWGILGYELEIPARANGHIVDVLDRYQVPFVLEALC